MKNIVFLFILVVFSLPAMAGSEDILGEWTTAEGKSKVNIQRCGASYCGTVVWLKEPNFPSGDEGGMAGKPKVDRENPSRNLRSRSILNLKILEGFRYAGGNEWEDGEIYDPKNGKTYSSILRLKNPKTLNVRGYVGFSFLGRTTVWTRD